MECERIFKYVMKQIFLLFTFIVKTQILYTLRNITYYFTIKIMKIITVTVERR